MITINSFENSTIMFSSNPILDTISEPKTHHLPQPKSLIRVGNTMADSWTRKIAASSLAIKSLNSLFYSLIMNQLLDLDSAYISGRDNQVANKISCIRKDNITPANCLF